MRRLAVLLALLLVSACEEERLPMERGRVMALADNLLLREELDWGPVTRVWPPTPGPDGRTWWQVDYRAPEPLARLPVVLVDADTGWARFPPPGFRPRSAVVPLPAPATDDNRPAVAAPSPGSWILVVTLAEEDAEALAGAAQRLNGRARAEGLAPLFTLRRPRAGDVELVYGWDGTRGIAPDESVERWVRRAAEPRALHWVDLEGR